MHLRRIIDYLWHFSNPQLWYLISWEQHSTIIYLSGEFTNSSDKSLTLKWCVSFANYPSEISLRGIVFTPIHRVHFRACTLLLLPEDISWIRILFFFFFFTKANICVSTWVKNVCTFATSVTARVICADKKYQRWLYPYVLLVLQVWHSQYHSPGLRPFAPGPSPQEECRWLGTVLGSGRYDHLSLRTQFSHLQW